MIERKTIALYSLAARPEPENPGMKGEKMSDIYLVLNETAHGKRFWRSTYDPVLERLTGSNGRTVAVYGPAEVGPNGYATEKEAVEALADYYDVDLSEWL